MFLGSAWTSKLSCPLLNLQSHTHREGEHRPRLVLLWPRCHFTSCRPWRSNPGSGDSAVHLGPNTPSHSWLWLLSEQHGQTDAVPGDPLSQGTAPMSVPARSQPRQHSYLAGRKLQSKWHSMPTLNTCSPWANGGNTRSGRPAALCAVSFSSVDKTLITHPPTINNTTTDYDPPTVSYTHPDKKIKSIILTQLAKQKLADLFQDQQGNEVFETWGLGTQMYPWFCFLRQKQPVKHVFGESILIFKTFLANPTPAC